MLNLTLDSVFYFKYIPHRLWHKCRAYHSAFLRTMIHQETPFPGCQHSESCGEQGLRACVPTGLGLGRNAGRVPHWQRCAVITGGAAAAEQSGTLHALSRGGKHVNESMTLSPSLRLSPLPLSLDIHCAFPRGPHSLCSWPAAGYTGPLVQLHADLSQEPPLGSRP